MSSYFDIMQRASTDRWVRRLASQIADCDFPLERYLEFVFPGGNYLISEESYADKHSRWGSYIGGGLGSMFGGPVGTGLGMWAGNKIGKWWGGRKDTQQVANPEYWQKRFNHAFDQLQQVMQGIGQNVTDPAFVEKLKPQDLIGKVEKAVGEWKKAGQAQAQGKAPSQPQSQAFGGGSVTTDQATAPPQPQAAPTIGGSISTDNSGGGPPVPTGPTSQPVQAQGTPQPDSGVYATTGEADPEEQKKQAAFWQAQQAKMNAWFQPRGTVFTESRFRGGYRRIDPRIWG